jgi:hypothetical protein
MDRGPPAPAVGECETRPRSRRGGGCLSERVPFVCNSPLLAWHALLPSLRAMFPSFPALPSPSPVGRLESAVGPNRQTCCRRAVRSCSRNSALAHVHTFMDMPPQRSRALEGPEIAACTANPRDISGSSPFPASRSTSPRALRGRARPSPRSRPFLVPRPHDGLLLLLLRERCRPRGRCPDLVEVRHGAGRGHRRGRRRGRRCRGRR